MNEVAFDRMISDEYERYKIIEKEYQRYKPVRTEDKVYRTYKRVSVKKGAYKTLIQWEEQVLGNFQEFSISWIADTAKILDYRRKLKKKRLFMTAAISAFVIVIMLIAAVSLTAIGLDKRLTLAVLGLSAVAAYFIFRWTAEAFNRILFYEELSRVLKQMTTDISKGGEQ